MENKDSSWLRLKINPRQNISPALLFSSRLCNNNNNKKILFSNEINKKRKRRKNHPTFISFIRSLLIYSYSFLIHLCLITCPEISLHPRKWMLFHLISLSSSILSLQAAWIKVETKAILTIHHHIITRNYRISLSHSDNRNFVLHIRNVQKSDRGGYMCQINTVPMKSQIGYVDVLGKCCSSHPFISI